MLWASGLVEPKAEALEAWKGSGKAHVWGAARVHAWAAAKGWSMVRPRKLARAERLPRHCDLLFQRFEFKKFELYFLNNCFQCNLF